MSLHKRLNQLVMLHTGQTLSPSMQSRLSAIIEQQAKVLGYQRPDDYVNDLEIPKTAQESQALQTLINLNTVGKTSFFRYPEQLRLLLEVLIPDLDAMVSPRQSINIWCAACSTGEEPYSLAMSLSAAGWYDSGKQRVIRIMATDVNTDRLAFARSGRVHSLREATLPEWSRRFTQMTPSGLYIEPSIRHRIEFASVNLIEPSTYPRVSSGWHIVVCANVLFYFDNAVARQVLDSLAASMASASALVLGGAETLPRAGTRFAVAHAQGAFAYLLGRWDRRIKPLGNNLLPMTPATDVLPSQVKQVLRKAPASRPAKAQPRPPAVDLSGLPAMLKTGNRKAALALLSSLGKQASGDMQRLMGVLWLREHRFQEACAALEEACEKDPLEFEGQYYLGVAYSKSKLPHEAVAVLRKALFLRPRSILTRYEFACQLQLTGDLERAREEYEKTGQYLQEGEIPQLDGCRFATVFAESLPGAAHMLSLIVGKLATLP